MLKQMILTGSLALLVLGMASITLGGIPDLSNSTAIRAYDGPETLSLLNFPDGSGFPFTQAILPGTPDGGPPAFRDATITLTLLDGDFVAISDFPFEDIWIASDDGGMVACIGGTNANYNTDMNGQTTWSYPLLAGGWSTAPMMVIISGFTLVDSPILLNVNSPDLNGDGSVNVNDVGYFTNDYFGPYNYRADYNFDGVVNLSDLGFLASGLWANCP